VADGRAAQLPSVSVVVCAHADERLGDLWEAVASLKAQTVRPREIVVVIDHNPRLLRSARLELDGVAVIPNPGPPGASAARNAGVAAASGEIVAFIDDDAVAEPEWLEALLSHYRHQRVVGVGGRIVPLWDSTRPTWLPDEFHWVVGASYRGLPELAAEVRNVWTGSMTIRREAFDRVGGFLPGYGKVGNRSRPEDTELCVRSARAWADGTWIFEPASVVHHKVPPSRATWRFFASRCYAEGLGKAELYAMSSGGRVSTTERQHVTRALSRGVVRGLDDLIRRGDPSGITRASAIVAGLTVTCTGLMAGRVASRRGAIALSPDSAGRL
jgi:glucosyl-dolichyl phosphate glucuronosyltransferase